MFSRYLITTKIEPLKHANHIKYYNIFSPYLYKYYKQNKDMKDLYIYKLYLDDKYITTNLENKDLLILKIDRNNEKYFQKYNYLSRYDEGYSLCHNKIITNFSGVELLNYSKKDNNESLEKIGYIWDLDCVKIDLELMKKISY